MKITVLAENTAYNSRFGCEHGLSLYIETLGHKLLFDMGQTSLFEENARLCGVELKEIDIAVLSHGHYDHGGGLGLFLSLNDHAPVYVNRYAFEPHYNGTEKYIGLDTGLRDSKRLVFTDDEYSIVPELTLYSCRGKRKVHDSGSAGLNMMENGRLVPEDFRHEQYLLAEENGRRILISGCSHKGILNIMNWFSPDVLIGGFHLMKQQPDSSLSFCTDSLGGYDTEYYTCHCTGKEQFLWMEQNISRPERFHYISAGQTFEV